MELGKLCPDCKEIRINLDRGKCAKCYAKWYHKQEKKNKTNCPECKNLRVCKHKGLCQSCYNRIWRHDKHLKTITKIRARKDFNLSYKQYKNLTKRCLICGFDNVVELHHFDRNKKNNNKANLVPLCPNHHRMAHNLKYNQEIDLIIKGK